MLSRLRDKFERLASRRSLGRGACNKRRILLGANWLDRLHSMGWLAVEPLRSTTVFVLPAAIVRNGPGRRSNEARGPAKLRAGSFSGLAAN